MNVLWINHRDPEHPEAGGAEVRIREIGKRLVKMGYDITLLAERFDGGGDRTHIDGMEVIRVGGRYSVHLLAPLFVKRFGADYDVILDDIAHGVPWLSPIFSRKPVIAQIHHPHQQVAWVELPSHQALFLTVAERATRYLYKTIITVSDSTKESLVNHFKIPEDKVVVIPNGVGEAYKPSPSKFERPTILWVGRVKRYKRLDHLLLAFKELKKTVPDARLVVVGDGEYLRNIKALAIKLKLHDVVFMGRVPEEEKVALMGRSWLIVSTSLVEGFGLVVAEANACGTPAVAYDVPGLRDVIVDGETGILVREKGDVKSLAAAITRLLKDQALRMELSHRALEHSRKFSWDKTAHQFHNIINASLG